MHDHQEHGIFFSKNSKVIGRQVPCLPECNSAVQKKDDEMSYRDPVALQGKEIRPPMYIPAFHVSEWNFSGSYLSQKQE